MRARHLLVPLLALVPLVACSSDDVGEGPTGLDVRGTYTVTGSFAIHDAGNPVDSYVCNGTVTIPDQLGNQFSGRWRNCRVGRW